MTTADREATRALLAGRHPDADRFADDAFLSWLYDGNPVGPAIECDRDGPEGRLGHVGLVPQRWERGEQAVGAVLAVNVVTSTESHEPHFIDLLLEGVAVAVEQQGHSVVWGVTNDQSTEITDRGLPARLLRPLPVTLARGARPRDVTSTAVDPAALSADWIESTVGPLTSSPPPGWRQCWTSELLAWRLGAPGHHYALHVGPTAVAVSTTVTRGIRIGVLAKVIPRADRATALEVRRLVGAVRRHHRVGPVVYAGFNGSAPVRGLRVPRILRPAALNLFVGGVDDIDSLGIAVPAASPQVTTDEIVFDAFELLDFDAL